jgi:20S proteasome alpha/beta subunit
MIASTRQEQDKQIRPLLQLQAIRSAVFTLIFLKAAEHDNLLLTLLLFSKISTGKMTHVKLFWFLVLLLRHTPFLPGDTATGCPLFANAITSSGDSSYVSVRSLDKYGEAVQISHALEAAVRHGRPIIVAVVRTNRNTTDATSFMVAVSLGKSPILHSLQLPLPQQEVDWIPSSLSFLAICCTGVRGDANWLIRQMQQFSASVWERYNLPQLSTPAVAHVVARLMGRFAGYPEKEEWNSAVGIPGSRGNGDDDQSQSSTWARPMGIQTMIVSTSPSSSVPPLLQVDPSGRILTPQARSSSGHVAVAAIGRDSDKIQRRLMTLFERSRDKSLLSWEDTPPNLEQCQETLKKILLEEFSAKGSGNDLVAVETFSSSSGRLVRNRL